MHIYTYNTQKYITSVYICSQYKYKYMVNIYTYIHANRSAVHTYGAAYVPTARCCSLAAPHQAPTLLGQGGADLAG